LLIFPLSHSAEQLVGLIHEQPIINACSVLLNRVYLHSLLLHGLPSHANPNTKRFLSAFMIVHHTPNVLNIMDQPAEALLASATAMLDTFEEILGGIRTHGGLHNVDRELTALFPTQLEDYLLCFEEWRRIDLVRTIRRIKSNLHVLHQSKAQIPLDNTSVRGVLSEQIEHLLATLRKVAGQEHARLFEQELASGTAQTDPIVEVVVAQPDMTSAEQLSHEILLNPQFRMDEQYESQEKKDFHQVGRLFPLLRKIAN
jgi:hypothetical protein